MTRKIHEHEAAFQLNELRRASELLALQAIRDGNKRAAEYELTHDALALAIHLIQGAWSPEDATFEDRELRALMASRVK